MSEISFFKYQGTGNDFIMIDNRNHFFDSQDLNLVRKLCDRRFGIGADGLILIENEKDLDFKMIYFNSDGSQSFCGNGARCSVRFAYQLGIFVKDTQFRAIDGIHYAKYLGDDEVELKMSDVTDIELIGDDYFINTGSPHYIHFQDDISNLEIVPAAHEIRYNERFKLSGTNVNFVKLSDDEICMRTYERGVEDETLSCGTGVTAVALSIANLKNKNTGEYLIKVEGGELRVSFEKKDNGYENIWLKGKAERVFSGVINIEKR